MTTQQNRSALHDLLAKADPGRAARAMERPVQGATWNGMSWNGTCAGAGGQVYRCRILLTVGHRSFNCTCQDKRGRAHEVGPCKHVIALAREGITQLWVLLEREEGSSQTAWA